MFYIIPQLEGTGRKSIDKNSKPVIFFCIGGHRANFLKIDKRGQILPISAHEMAPMRAFSVLQKWPKIAKITPNDLLTLKMVFTESLMKTERNTVLVS